MDKAEIKGIAPLLIVRSVPETLSFYRDRLGFEVTFQGPTEDDVFFGVIQRDAAMIMFKDVGIDPKPNHKKDVQKGIARWDAYIYVPDPDTLAMEFTSREVDFFQALKNHDEDGLRGFEIQDNNGYILFFGRPQ